MQKWQKYPNCIRIYRTCNIIDYNFVICLLITLIDFLKVQALFTSSSESHPSAITKINPSEIDDHQRARAKRFNFGVPNVYEGKNFLKELLAERRLEAAIAEAEAAYKKASDLLTTRYFK